MIPCSLRIVLAAILFFTPGLLFATPEDNGDTPFEILFLGDSLTAGYGIDPEETYPALIEKKLAEREGAYRVRNAGISGDTTAAALRRMNWLLREPADLLVIALGGNDGLRGVSARETERNLRAIIETAREATPDIRILLTGQQIPPNYGAAYTETFREIFPRVAEETGVALLPFLLENVGGDPEANLPDGIHPNPQGHHRIAQTVWQALQPLLPGKEG